jgi:phage tail-like protein
MQRPQIDRLLPGMYQRVAEPGTMLAAALDVMAELHERDEEILTGIDAYFDPYRAPDGHLAFLARWVDLDRLLPPDAATDQPVPFPSGYGCLRNLIAGAADLAQWRGTSAGLRWFLQLATGVAGFTIDEAVPGRVFHIRVHVPEAAAPYLELVERIVAMEKPAFVTAEMIVGDGPAELVPSSAPPAPGAVEGASA